MRPWHTPSHRNPNDLQIEFCDVCGTAVGASHLVLSQVQGLRGARVCDAHPRETEFRVRESFVDMGGTGQGQLEKLELRPHGGTDWWAANAQFPEGDFP